MNNQGPSAKRKRLEKMADFFVARLDGYEEHMLTETGKEAYKELAELVPENTEKLLDLGCGTGLELDEIFRRLPEVSVMGIDLTQTMLDKLREKHPGKNLELICEDYLKADFGENIFDAAVSFMTIHHFLHDEKVRLYARIREALKPDGVYIEVDYIASDQSVEDELYNEYLRLRREEGIPEGEYYHIDIPYTVDNQVKMFKEAGFTTIEVVSQAENAAMILARK